MNRICLSAVCVLLFASAAPSQALPIELIYDPATGNVTLDTNDPTWRIRHYRIASSSNSLIVANHNIVVPNPTILSLTPSQIYIVSNPAANPAIAVAADPSLAAYIDGTQWNMGEILPAGLTEQQYNDAISFTDIRTVELLSMPADLVYVPEPTSLALLGFGGLLVMRRRR